MEKNKAKESREEVLERILEETARNPYRPGERKKSQPAKPIRKEYVQRTQVFSSAEAQAALLAEMEADTPPKKTTERGSVKLPDRNFAREDRSRSEAVKPTVNETVHIENENDKYAALEKINRIKKEKAAAAKEAIKKKAELENAIRAQENSDNQTKISSPVFSESGGEKVNIFNPDEEEEQEPKDISILLEASNLFQNAICVVFALFVIFTQIFVFSGTSGESMSPTLSDGDQLICLDAFYKPSQGDVVIIDNKTSALLDENKKITEKTGLDCRIVKRIIALGGDTVDIDFENGIVNVNGKALEEKYISEPTTRDEGAFEYPLTVPDGYAFVLGDNRNISKDSRHEDVGLIPEDEIAGKVILRYYPLGSFGTVE